MKNPAPNANFQATVVMGVLVITNDMLTINDSSDTFGLQFNGCRNELNL